VLNCWICTDISKESNVLFRVKLSKNCLESMPCKRYWLSTSPHGVTFGNAVFSMTPLWEIPFSHSTHSVFAGGRNLENHFLLFWRISCLDTQIPLQCLSISSRIRLDFCWQLFSVTCKSGTVRGNMSLKKAGVRLQHCVLLFGPSRSRFIPFDIFVSSLTS